MQQPKIVRFVLAFLLLLTMGAPLAAEELIASGDSENLWIVRQNADGKGITVLHRRAGDQPESKLQSTGGLTRTLIPGGAIAGQGFLWLFYTDGSVQALRAVDEVTGRRFTDKIVTAMPAGVTVRSLAVTQAGAWALVRVEDPKALKEIDFPQQPPTGWHEKQKRRAASSIAVTTAKDEPARPDAPPAKDSPATKDAPSSKDSPPKVAPVKDAAAKDRLDGKPSKDSAPKIAPEPTKDAAPLVPPVQPPAEATSLKVDRLLHLGKDEWEKIELPADWNQDLPAWLVTTSHDEERPLLVTAVNSEKLLRWYHWDKVDEKSDKPAEWISARQAIEGGVRLAPTSLNRKLCLVNRLNSPGKIELSVAIIRPDGVLDVGSVAMEDSEQWALTPVGEQLALVTADKTGALFMKRINNKGIADANPIPLAIEPPSLGQVADLLVYVVVLALATPILILMWKRESGPLVPQLPRSLRIAEMAPRGIAALIDIVPCIGIATVICDVSPADLLQYWPGRSGGWERMIPGAIAIGLYVAHTFFSELFTARTLGKALMGLRITGLRGEPPDLWQALARNIFKVLDLILMPLLIFAIISPNRQRLGDVVARTLVVTRGAADEGGPPSGEKDDEAAQKKRDLPPDPRPKRSK